MLENLTKNGCYSFSPRPLNHCLLCSGFAFSYLAIFIHSLFSQQKIEGFCQNFYVVVQHLHLSWTEVSFALKMHFLILQGAKVVFNGLNGG